ncbi:MAG: hypothetical protein HFI75_11545 [Lachnospiraceae bacterium]|nr:hypothetical protein [Lachnospiraceae bacterium]
MFFHSILSSSQIVQQLKQLAIQFPDFTQLRFEGLSEEERSIYSLTLGRGNKTLICTGGVHGRESINPTVLVEMIKVYCDNYTTSPQQYPWNYLQTYKILFIPLLNPDGYEIALRGRSDSGAEIKNQPLAREWKYNARGVDINRNFPCQSYRKQDSSDRPFSAVESRILANIFQREASIGYIDFHSRGQEIFWYRAALDAAYNERQKKIAEALESVCHYRIGTPQDEQTDAYSGGNTVQYYSEQYRLPAITMETVPEEAEFPLSPHWLEITYEEIQKIPLCFIDCIHTSDISGNQKG